MTAPLVLALFVLLGCQASPASTVASGAPSAPAVTTGSGQTAAPSADPMAGGSPSTGLECPGDTSDINVLIPMDPGARLICFGNRPITLAAYIPFQEHVCGDTGIEPSWLGGCSEVIDLHGEASDFSADLPARVHPSTGLQAISLKQRVWVQVTGHFDDPAALTCQQTPPPGTVAQPAEATILDCRRQFVITELREIAAP